LLTDADYRAQAEFRYAMRRFMHFSEESARAAGITPQQHLLLLAVRGHPSYPAVNITEIAEHLQVRHHSASLLVDRAVNRMVGQERQEPAPLLYRVQDSTDRRRALVSLTPEGEEILACITAENRRVLADFERVLDNMRASLLRAH
jgi:DNA-binding MarR family transcriptional regulator